MDSLKRGDEFPGLENVLEYLPHPGEVFLVSFSRFSLVALRPEIRRGVTSDYVNLLVFRGEKQLFNNQETYVRICLSEIENIFPPFQILSVHVGMDLNQVAEKKRNFLRNELLKILSGVAFRLELSPNCQKDLQDPNKFAAYFWEEAHYKNGICTVHQKERSTLWFRVEQAGVEPIKGLEFDPSGLFGLGGTWEDIIEESIQCQYLKTVIRWYKNWVDIKSFSERGIAVDLEATWTQCVHDLTK